MQALVQAIQNRLGGKSNPNGGFQSGGYPGEGFDPNGNPQEGGTALDKFSRDLTKAAKSGEIDPGYRQRKRD